MRQWLDWAGKLYPKAWRDRYGLEFDGLLSDVQLHWSDLFDVLRGAAVMQVRSMSTYLKLACAVTLAGMVLALAASFTVPMPYMSSALIRVAPDEPGRGGADPQLPDSLNRAWLNVTSRSSLAELILRPSLDLYRSARNRKPLEEVIADMKRDIRIETIDASDPAATFRVSFMYPDRYKAQAVADALTMRLRSAPALSGDFLVVQRANLPETPLTQYRLAYLGWGLGLGALCGAVAASLRWRAKWTLQVIGCGFAGWLITLLVVFNGFIYLERPLGWYTSNALVELSVTEGQAPRLMTDGQVAAWLQKHETLILSDTSLSEPAERLYRAERARMPLQAVLTKMRKDIAIRPVNGRSAVNISFTHHDRFKAQLGVSVILTKLIDQNQQEARQRYKASMAAGQGPAHILAYSLDLLDPASLPVRMEPSPQSIALGMAAVWMTLGGYLFRNGRRSGPEAAKFFPSVKWFRKATGGPPPAAGLRHATLPNG